MELSSAWPGVAPCIRRLRDDHMRAKRVIWGPGKVRWIVMASWLKWPVDASNWETAYWLAKAKKPRKIKYRRQR